MARNYEKENQRAVEMQQRAMLLSPETRVKDTIASIYGGHVNMNGDTRSDDVFKKSLKGVYEKGNAGTDRQAFLEASAETVHMLQYDALTSQNSFDSDVLYDKASPTSLQKLELQDALEAFEQEKKNFYDKTLANYEKSTGVLLERRDLQDLTQGFEASDELIADDPSPEDLAQFELDMQNGEAFQDKELTEEDWVQMEREFGQEVDLPEHVENPAELSPYDYMEQDNKPTPREKAASVSGLNYGSAAPEVSKAKTNRRTYSQVRAEERAAKDVKEVSDEKYDRYARDVNKQNDSYQKDTAGDQYGFDETESYAKVANNNNTASEEELEDDGPEL